MLSILFRPQCVMINDYQFMIVPENICKIGVSLMLQMMVSLSQQSQFYHIGLYQFFKQFYSNSA